MGQFWIDAEGSMYLSLPTLKSTSNPQILCPFHHAVTCMTILQDVTERRKTGYAFGSSFYHQSRKYVCCHLSPNAFFLVAESP